MTIQYTWKAFGLALMFSRYGGDFYVAVILPFCGLRLKFELAKKETHEQRQPSYRN